MDIQGLIKKVVRETTSFPLLFVPFFLTAILNGILGTDRVLFAFGSSRSIILQLIVLLLLTPVASGMTIFMDRYIHSGEEPNPGTAFSHVRAIYWPLIGVNLVAWTGIILGFLLFIVPGVYLYVKFIFTTQEVLLGGETDILEAIRNSWDRTTNRWGQLFQIILIFELPLLLLSFSLGGLPAGWGATVSVLLSTVFQTWITLVITHIYVGIRGQ